VLVGEFCYTARDPRCILVVQRLSSLRRVGAGELQVGSHLLFGLEVIPLVVVRIVQYRGLDAVKHWKLA